MKYRIRHCEDGKEVGFAERRDIGKVRDEVGRMLVSSRDRLNLAQHRASPLRRAFAQRDALTRESFGTSGIVNILIDAVSIRIDQEA